MFLRTTGTTVSENVVASWDGGCVLEVGDSVEVGGMKRRMLTGSQLVNF